MGSIVSSVLEPFTGAKKTQAAAAQAAAQQREAAQNAAQAAAFRPVGMTTRFGTATFERAIDPETGMPYVSAAEYSPAGDIAAIRDRLVQNVPGMLSQAEGISGQVAPLGLASAGLFNLGAQYLAQSPEEAAQRFVESQQRLLAPQREQQLAGIRNRLFQTGRTGLQTGGTSTGMAASNPELQAYYNALAQQDAQLAAQAEQAGQQRALFGAGLFGTGGGLLGTMSQLQAGALAPAQANIGFATQLENLAQQPLQLGLQLGTAQQPGQQAGAQLYNQGYQQAANTMYQGTQQANALNAQFLSSLVGAAAMGAGGGMGRAAGGAGGGLFGGGTQGFGQFTRNLFNFTPDAGMASTVSGLRSSNIL